MALQVGLVDHVDAILIAEVIPRRLVGIVAGTDGINVVSAEGLHSGGYICHTDRPARIWVSLMAVDTVKHDPLNSLARQRKRFILAALAIPVLLLACFVVVPAIDFVRMNFTD